MPTVVNDFWFSVRQLLKRPAFFSLAVIALALGTGGMTAMFSVVDAVLLKPLPFPQPDELVSLCESHPSVEQFCVVSPPNAADWATRSGAIASIGQGRTWPFKLRAGEAAESVRGGLATPSLFSTLQVHAALGRVFNTDEVGPAAHVALLSHSYWMTRFGGDRSIVGRTIDVDAVDYEVIGVLAFAAAVPGLEMVEVWTPLPFNPRDEEQRRWRGFVTIARLRPGATARSAEAELNVIQAALAREHPRTNEGWSARVVPLLETITGTVRPILLALLAAVTLLLLIACANVASLLVARGVARERELAVRAAIGASRWSLIRLLAVESAVVAGAGGIMGVAAALWVADALVAMMPGALPRIDHVPIDLRVFAAAVALTIIAGILAGIAPALRAARVDVVESLKEGLQPSAWRSALGLRRALLVAEVAFAVVLAVGAGLFGRAFAKYLDWQPGFEPRGLVTLWTFASQGAYKDAMSVSSLFDRIEHELSTVPGVTAVGTAANGPLFGGTESGDFTLPGLRSSEPVTANWFDISPTYFQTLRLPVVLGRAFTPADRAGAPLVAMVNETFVKRYVRDRSPLGQRLVYRDREMEIVGVVSDVPAFTPGVGTKPEVYWPYQQAPRWASYFVIRSGLPPDALRKTVEARLRAIDRDLVVSNYATMEERIDRQLARPRFQMSLVGAFAVMALALTIIGVYGMMASLVANRQRELGVRVALGATRVTLLAMVVRQALVLAGAGLLVGITLSIGAARFLQSVLHGVTPTDPVTYAGVAAVVLGSAIVAALNPARRAASTDPLKMLRAE